MAQKLIQTQTLRQQQTLAPLQVQFVRMLEMNEPEVEEEIRRALDENPALEAVTDDVHHASEESAEQMQLADYRTAEEVPSGQMARARSEARPDFTGATAESAGESMMDALMRQLHEMWALTPLQHRIAVAVIGNIDSNGYMSRSVSAIATDLSMTGDTEVEPQQVDEVWRMVRTLDPPGIGATDLRDTLLMQLARLQPSPDRDTAVRMIESHFDLFASMRLDRLRRRLHVSSVELSDALALIRTLNPKPGALFAGNDMDSRLNHITPDFQVEMDGDDRLVVSLLNSNPALQVESSFAVDAPVATGRGGERNEAANAFIRQRREDAVNFIRALEMRQTTLYKVMLAVASRQRRFFMTGDPMSLKPMVLKDIASDTGYDVSVVSRSTAGKYVSTPFGVYPLRYFFNERHQSGESHSSAQILEALRRLIEAEDGSAPLTDQALSQALAADGFDVARRTVAKYRERLGLPPARMRRRLKSGDAEFKN